MKKIAMIMLLCLVANAVATAQHHSKQKNKNGIEYVSGRNPGSYGCPECAVILKKGHRQVSLG